jgi:hypothetical protein
MKRLPLYCCTAAHTAILQNILMWRTFSHPLRAQSTTGRPVLCAAAAAAVTHCLLLPLPAATGAC